MPVLTPKSQLLRRALLIHGASIVLCVSAASAPAHVVSQLNGAAALLLGFGLCWANVKYIASSNPNRVVAQVIVGLLSLFSCVGTTITVVLLAL